MVKVKKGKDGKRKETRAEKHARVESQREAREACEKVLPYVAGAVLVLLLVFTLYVRSVPPKQPTKQPKPIVKPPPGGKIIPEFMNIDTTSSAKKADMGKEPQPEQQAASSSGSDETKE